MRARCWSGVMFGSMPSHDGGVGAAVPRLAAMASGDKSAAGPGGAAGAVIVGAAGALLPPNTPAPLRPPNKLPAAATAAMMVSMPTNPEGIDRRSAQNRADDKTDLPCRDSNHCPGRVIAAGRLYLRPTL